MLFFRMGRPGRRGVTDRAAGDVDVDVDVVGWAGLCCSSEVEDKVVAGREGVPEREAVESEMEEEEEDVWVVKVEVLLLFPKSCFRLAILFDMMADAAAATGVTAVGVWPVRVGAVWGAFGVASRKGLAGSGEFAKGLTCLSLGRGDSNTCEEAGV